MSIVDTIFGEPTINTLTGELETTLEPWMFFTCVSVAFALGLVAAFCYMFKNMYSKTLVVTIAILPPIVCVLIMLVSGSIGAAVAVGGVFSLTRFRSAQGSAREITQIFLSMAVGLITGLGYIYIALILVAIIEAATIISQLQSLASQVQKEGHSRFLFPKSLIIPICSMICLINILQVLPQ